MCDAEGQGTAACYNNPLLLYFQFNFLWVTEHPAEPKSFTHTVGAKKCVCEEFAGPAPSSFPWECSLAEGRFLQGSVGRSCQTRLVLIPLNTWVSTCPNVVERAVGDKTVVTLRFIQRWAATADAFHNAFIIFFYIYIDFCLSRNVSVNSEWLLTVKNNS